jgi:hypothetical protein
MFVSNVRHCEFCFFNFKSVGLIESRPSEISKLIHFERRECEVFLSINSSFLTATFYLGIMMSFLLLLCNNDGLAKTKTAIKSAGIDFLFESNEYDGGKLWVAAGVNSTQLEALEKKLPKKTSRGFLLLEEFGVTVLAGNDGALTDNLFDARFVFTYGLKVAKAKVDVVKGKLSGNPFLNKCEEIDEGNIVTFRVDTSIAGDPFLSVDMVINEFGKNVILDSSEFYNVCFNRNKKLITEGSLDQANSAYCGPMVIISFKLPTGEEAVIDPEQGGLVWL